MNSEWAFYEIVLVVIFGTTIWLFHIVSRYRLYRMGADLLPFIARAFFIGGMLSVLLAIAGQKLFYAVLLHNNIFLDYHFVSHALADALYTGFEEEICKLLVTVIVMKPSKKYPRLVNSYTYAMLVSLGFQTLENIKYGFEFGLTVFLIRSFLPMHLLFSSIWGRGLYVMMNRSNHTVGIAHLLFYLLLASLLHGFYDFFLFIEVSPEREVYRLFVLPFVFLFYVPLYKYIVK